MTKNQDLLQVNIYSPEGLVYTHYSRGVVIKTTGGDMMIMPNHVPVIASLTVGAVKVLRRDESIKDNFIAINGGIIEMHDNIVEIMATFAIRSSDIDEAQAHIDKQEAEAALETAVSKEDMIAYRRAQIALNRAINMINVSEKNL